MDCAPENAIVRYYQKTGRTTEKLWNIFGKFYRVNLEILGYPSRVSLPKNTPGYSGGYSFLSSGSGRVLANMFRVSGGRVLPKSLRAGGRAGRGFLVPDPSLVLGVVSTTRH